MKAAVVGLSLLFVLGGCGSRSSATRNNPEAWRADLRQLARELPRLHANAFHTVNRQRFAAEVAQLDTAIPRLNADQILVGLMRVVALVGDGHTHLGLPPSWPRYPIEMVWFGDELRIVAALDSYRAVSGAKVLGIGNLPLESLVGLASQLVPRGENAGRTRHNVASLLNSPAVLHGLGVVPSPDAAPFHLQTAAGNSVIVTIHPVPARTMSGLRLAVERPPLWLQKLKEPWWAEVLPDSHTVYLSFNSYPPQAEFQKRAEDLGRLLDKPNTQRLVIDLRRNGGGDFERFRRFLLPAIRSRPALTRSGSVYAITGPATFSAAMVNALDLRQRANAVLVGEPTGARPNAYGEHGDFRLANSGLSVAYSTRYYRFAADRDTAVVPDKLIESIWEQFQSGRDPVLEWILVQRINGP